MINVNLIRAFEGPRHSDLEDIWHVYAEHHRDEINVIVHDNLGDRRLSHDAMLSKMWMQERGRPESICVFTEFDFLPAPCFAQRVGQSDFTLLEPIEAVRYCTRDPRTKVLLPTDLPGAWFIRIMKPFLRAEPYFWAGPCQDPANHLGLALGFSGQRVRLLDQEDCLPEHFGTRTSPYGEHLFWSRHYNGTPTDFEYVPDLPAILHGVDTAIERWWEQWRQ